MRIFLIPIEPLEERYSKQWETWWPDGFKACGHEVFVMSGEALSTKIRTGQFLDAYGTNRYKASQMVDIAGVFAAGEVRDGDVFLFLDGWNPCVEMLAYMRDAGKHNIVIGGVFHAGTYDPQDFITQAGMGRWAEHAERAWSVIYDHMFVATQFHKKILATHCMDTSKIHVTGMTLFPAQWEQHWAPWQQRPRRVVFPHRLAPEKGVELWHKLQMAYVAQFPDDPVEFVETGGLTKAAYYARLGSCRVAFSAAKQETWGMSMQEAASLGCHCIVPNALAYPELFGQHQVYDPLNVDPITLAEHVQVFLNEDEPYRWPSEQWTMTIPKIAEILSLHSRRIRLR